MDIGQIQLNSIGLSTPASPRRAHSISPVRRQSLREEGKCVRCGSWRHWVSDCPLEPHRPSSPEQQQFLRRDTTARRQVYRPTPGSRHPPGPTINQLDTGSGYTSEQERRWMEEWEASRYDSDKDSVGSDLVRLQKGQL